MDALAKLHFTVSRAYKINPKIKFEVFIHKVDGLSDDHKIETQRDIHQRATDDLVDAGLENLHLRFVHNIYMYILNRQHILIIVNINIITCTC
jgi:Ras-related GTP-binding protein C/D